MLPGSELHELVDLCRRSVPFAGFMMSGCGIAQLGPASGNILATDFPLVLVRRIVAEHWHECDAAVVAALESHGIVGPSELARIAARDALMASRLEARREYGLGPSCVVPVLRAGRTVGAVEFTRDAPPTPREAQYLEMIAATLFREALRLNPPDLRRFTPSRRELDCLRLSSEGRTNAEIAAAFAISAQTVAFHIKRCCVKLSAGNKVGAVAEAIRRGLIE